MQNDKEIYILCIKREILSFIIYIQKYIHTITNYFMVNICTVKIMYQMVRKKTTTNERVFFYTSDSPLLFTDIIPVCPDSLSVPSSRF